MKLTCQQIDQSRNNINNYVYFIAWMGQKLKILSVFFENDYGMC